MRLFLAFDFGSSCRGTLEDSITALRPKQAKVKWVDPTHAHITIHFFGEVDENDVQRIVSIIQKSDALCSDILHLKLEDIGVFPNVRKPRTVWIGVGGDVAGLSRIQALLVNDLKENGFPVEVRKFVPHITLGRVKFLNNDTQFIRNIQDHTLSEQKTVKLDAVRLFKSELTQRGPIYTVLQTFRFKTKGCL